PWQRGTLSICMQIPLHPEMSRTSQSPLSVRRQPLMSSHILGLYAALSHKHTHTHTHTHTQTHTHTHTHTYTHTRTHTLTNTHKHIYTHRHRHTHTHTHTHTGKVCEPLSYVLMKCVNEDHSSESLSPLKLINDLISVSGFFSSDER